MDENILETRIKQRCDTESNWNASNPILLENEVGYIPDGRYKIGDGSSTWSSLPYNTADTANIATKSIQDSAGQQINITYIKGAPEKVEGVFNCNYCDKLTSLKGASKNVGGNFECRKCNNLKITDSDRKKYKIIY